MPSSTDLLAIAAFTAALSAVQLPYGMTHAGDDARPVVHAFAARPSTVTDLRGSSGSNPVPGGDIASGDKQDVSSEVDLATGDGQQRSVSELSPSCGNVKPVCRP